MNSYQMLEGRARKLARERGIPFADALAAACDSDPALATRAMKQQQSPPQPAETPVRRFIDEKAGAALAVVEETLDEAVSTILAGEGALTPTAEQRAKVMSRVLDGNPQLYSEYIANQRAAAREGRA